jgi:hypothetical protein
MTAMHDVLLAPHIAAGVIALVAMLVPLVTRKGSHAHRRGGWVFVIAMSGVSLTAFALAIWRFTMFDAAHPNAHANAVFLFYVATLTAAGVSTGVRALRLKRRTTPHLGAWDLGISAANLAMAVITLVYGLVTGRTLLMVFSSLGLFTGSLQLAYWLREPSERMHWWFAHMGNMLGSCIAALTALVVVNAARLGAPTFTTVVWIAVPVIGVPTIFGWSAYYRRRFAAKDPAELP